MSPAHRRVIAKDEELGKRSDDFRRNPLGSSGLNVAHSWRWRKRWRILALLLVLSLLYLVIRNIPAGPGPLEANVGSSRLGNVGHSSSELKEPTGPPPTDGSLAQDESSIHNYDGKVRYFRLAASLRAISRTMGRRQSNRNVLFAASSLKGLANLVPLACQMGRWDRNYVHFAVFGRDTLSMDEIMDINGVNSTDCNLFLHDARSDYAPYSSDQRAAVAVSGAMKHIEDFMHPQVIITDDEQVENDYFTLSMRQLSTDLNRALIEIPKGKYDDFLWMAKLDSGSLANWYQPTIDILIHAPSHSSGALLRTVKSLLEADYAGLKPPRLTVELPPDIDIFAERYLQYLSWPPGRSSSPLRPSALTLRHRIESSHIKPEEASLRFLESFYPTSTDNSHVLLLSSQAEVSPSYYHYLYYTLLEYRYSAYVAMDAVDLLGISLDVPNVLTDGKTGLVTPSISHMTSQRYTEDNKLDQSAPAPFLYGAPSSTASLMFGDKWVTFHGFLRRRIAASHAGVARKTEKLVTEAEPAWMEYLLELMRARGWYILHPASPFVTIHNDLTQIPEEFKRPKKDDGKDENDAAVAEPPEDEPFLLAAEAPIVPQRPEAEADHPHSPLHETLPFDGDLPELPNLPFIDHAGVRKTIDAPQLSRMSYAGDFRRTMGGCSEADADRPRIVPFLSADELFCLPGMDIEFDEYGVTEEEEIAESIVKDTEPPSAQSEGTEETSGDKDASTPAPESEEKGAK